MNEGKKERDEEMEQLTHDLAMGFMRKNSETIQRMMVDKLPRLLMNQTTNNHHTDLRLHDLGSSVNQLPLPVEQPVELHATGTDDSSYGGNVWCFNLMHNAQ